jgi:peptidoglycan/LPS O-acetylase OafA/YrhL
LTALPFAIGAWYELGFDAFPKILVNLALLQSWVPRSELYYSLNSVSWSLSNEIFFYSSFIFLTMLSTKALGRLILIWLAAIIFAATLGIYFDRASWGDGRVHYLFYINPIFRLLDFMVGMQIYRLFSARPPVNAVIHEFMSLTMLIAAMYFFSAYQLPDALRSQVLYLPIMAYMVWSYSGRGGLISRALSRPAIVLLGDASFALYMIHQPIITHGVSAIRRYDIVIDSTALALILIAVGIVASIAIYIYVELPIHTRLRVLIGKLNTEQASKVNG